MWARLKAQRICANTGSSSSVSQPGVRKSRCQPSSAQRASSRSMRGRMVAEKPGSGGFTGETLMRTPRTPSLSMIRQQRVRRVLVDVHDAAAARDPDLAHRVEHAGIVAAVGARLHEHEPLDAEMLCERQIVGQRRQRRRIAQRLVHAAMRIAIRRSEHVEMRVAGLRRRTERRAAAR